MPYLVGIMFYIFVLSMPASAQQVSIRGVDTSRYPEIAVIAEVQDHRQNVLEIQPGDHFTVYENGKLVATHAQAITHSEQRLVQKVSLILDNSSSMEGSLLNAAKQAARSMIESQPSNARTSLISFNSVIDTYFEVSPQTLLPYIDAMTASGGTSLYDAMLVALEQIPEGDTQRNTLILLTDGEDTSSSAKLEDVKIELEKRPLVQIYAIYLAGASKSELKNLAHSSNGGKVIDASSVTLLDVFGEVGEDLSRQVELRYTTPFPLADGMQRNLQLELNRAGQKIQTKQTYNMPGLIGAGHVNKHTFKIALLWLLILSTLTFTVKNRNWI